MTCARYCGIAFLFALTSAHLLAADGVFVRFQHVEPAETSWYVKLGGYIHNDPWYLSDAVWPTGADKQPQKRLPSGQFSPWFDLATHAGKRLHGRHNRAGGVAEFPNVTVEFFCAPTNPMRRVVIELATAPEDTAVVKRFEESFAGQKTSFLVSPTLRQDAAALETASQMSARRLAWARAASKGQRHSPTNLWVQTQLWAPQRPELNLQEAEVLWLLGFNLVGNGPDAIYEKFPFLQPAGHHWIEFGPAITREDIAKQLERPVRRAGQFASRPTLFGFSDEIVCRPGIGTNGAALSNFRAWLKERGFAPAEFGVSSLEEVTPIESPPELRARQKTNTVAANRLFYWTTRFRHESATQRIKWCTDYVHQHAPSNVLTTTLVADHPYFGGSGLGMGMSSANSTWGGSPLSLDWFSLARERVVDVMGIEDWLGLNYMYGPHSTWEGFQLIGFQAALFRSGSRGALPIITWITPSDETNLRLKSASALCQGAKHFFYWTYGPTATSTENYWSDLRSAYDGIVAITRQLAEAEHIIATGQTRPTRVAMLYSLSSDLWQPFGYLPMAERRLTYFSLIHNQFLVDFLTEEEVAAGRLKNYDAFYVTDPCVSDAACAAIANWVEKGGRLYGACAPANRNEFNEEKNALAKVFGIAPQLQLQVQPGRFDLRGGLNDLPWMDQAQLDPNGPQIGALGLKAKVVPAGAKVPGTFSDGSPAVLKNSYGNGSATYFATCPAVSYAKDAKFVAAELIEQWPLWQRMFINQIAQGTPKVVQLTQAVVEAGVFENTNGVALVLANFTYKPISDLGIRLPVKQAPKQVRSLEKGPLSFRVEAPSGMVMPRGYDKVAACSVSLGLNDIILFE